MRRADVDPQRLPLRPGVHSGGKGTQRLGQDHMGAAVQDPGHLGVALHRHGANRPLGTHLQEMDPHLHHQGAHAVLPQPFVHFLGNPGSRQLGRVTGPA